VSACPVPLVRHVQQVYARHGLEQLRRSRGSARPRTRAELPRARFRERDQPANVGGATWVAVTT